MKPLGMIGASIALFKSKKTRISCFIDGFNLYHAIDDIGAPHLKWANLRALMECFHDPATQEIGDIFYFSAIAEWLPNNAARHKIYIEALRAVGVTPVLGQFKRKQQTCRTCSSVWNTHEEKQTDVNIATWMIQEAFNNRFDQAFLISGDSDLVPPLRLIQQLPKKRSLKVISPPERRHAKELAKMATKLASIKRVHLERSLFDEQVMNDSGVVVARRPVAYTPPGSV